MKTTAQKWGNSLAIRIPKSVATQVGVKVQDDLEIEVQDGNVILEPQLRRVYRLEDLVKGITKKNRHREIDTGNPAGREIGDEEICLSRIRASFGSQIITL